MARAQQWRMSPGEVLVLACSLDSDLETDATLTGETPEITLHTENADGTFTDATADFTVAGETANASALTTSTGETIAIGKGVVFTLTASETAGTYWCRVECDADDGTHPTRTIKLIVEGPTAP